MLQLYKTSLMYFCRFVSLYEKRRMSLDGGNYGNILFVRMGGGFTVPYSLIFYRIFTHVSGNNGWYKIGAEFYKRQFYTRKFTVITFHAYTNCEIREFRSLISTVVIQSLK